MDQQTFRTVVPMSPSDTKIGHRDQILLIGSCFSEHIANRLNEHKFQVAKNPYGILYHPLAIAKNLEEIIAHKNYDAIDLVFHKKLWQSWNHHSDFSDLNQQDIIEKINSTITSAHKQLKTAKHLIITFGSAWAYRLKSTGELVANCHKFPNKEFEKELLSVEKITNRFIDLIEQLLVFNPKLNIHFTISPVRHLRDGFRENQWSKSTLQLAVQQLQKKYNQLHYFPSYELVMDDLRDYRFYNEDMVHPSNVAINYVWGLFSEVYFTPATLAINKQISKLISSSHHRPFQPASEAHQEFIRTTLESIQNLKKQYSFLDFKTEIDLLEAQMIYPLST
tara:strand:+ start:3426 stop:4433 length:1008 start_codon:yes stop_codon:yes gene_type:complete